MRFRLPKTRVLRWGLYAGLFVTLLGAGRLTQQAWDSFYLGARGPYLQSASPTTITVRWQTPVPGVGRVRYGLAPARLDSSASESGAARSHELRLEGLAPATRYYYAIEQGKETIAAGEGYSFVTPPVPGADTPVRFWVIGDSGDAGPNQQHVRDSALSWITANPRPGRADIDLWLALGDNAYTSGRNQEFQAAFFEPYAALLRSTAVWPVYGNHDARRWAYFDIFTLPQGGESGGAPSGSEHWYAFDHGPVHFVVLDSEESDRAQEGAMLRWLREDLAANRQPWLVAAFHHPPYSKGSHDSDAPGESGGRLRDMREQALPILEAAGVDLVLSGHSHQYERSHFLDCHYGTSDTLAADMVVSRNAEQPAVYSKAAGAHQGAIYAVVGSSSKLNRGLRAHPAMAVQLEALGSLVVDVSGNRLEARFIDDRGTVRDSFLIEKNAGPPTARASACR